MDNLSPPAETARRFNRFRLLALIPVFIAAVWHTGHQYTLSVKLLGEMPESDWRDTLVSKFGFELADISTMASLKAGLILVLCAVIVVVLAAAVLERVTSTAFHRNFDSGVLYFALLFALLMPPAASVFQLGFGITLGIFLGHTIFGGEGKTFLNPALVGAALTQVSFPTAGTDHPVWQEVNGYAGTTLFQHYAEQGSAGLTWLDIGWRDAFMGNIQGFLGTTSSLAILIGAVVLLAGQIISWRLLLAHVLGVAVIASLFNLAGEGMMSMPWHTHLVLGSFAFGVVFLAADPSSSCCTNAGRWIQGLLAGGLIVFMRVMNPAHPDSVIAVLLLMSMLAPLIDHLVTWWNIQGRLKQEPAVRQGGQREST